MEKELEGLNDVYQTIAQLTSVEDCLKIYQQFKGLTITFPTKLISSEYIKDHLYSEIKQGKKFSSKEIQNLARSFDYSERQIRRFISEVKKELDTDRVEEEGIPYVSEWLKKQGLEMISEEEEK